MKRSSLALTFFAAYAIACGGSARHTAGIVDSGDADLTDCTYLRKVNGSAADFDPNAASVSMRKAKAEAASIGAFVIGGLFDRGFGAHAFGAVAIGLLLVGIFAARESSS